MEKFLSGDAIYVNTRARGTAIDFMFGMSMRVLLLLTYIALPDPYFSTIVARKVPWTDSHHPLSRDFKQTQIRYHGYSMGNLDKTKVQERGIAKLNFVCESELMSFIADE